MLHRERERKGQYSLTGNVFQETRNDQASSQCATSALQVLYARSSICLQREAGPKNITCHSLFFFLLLFSFLYCTTTRAKKKKKEEKNAWVCSMIQSHYMLNWLSWALSDVHASSNRPNRLSDLPVVGHWLHRFSKAPLWKEIVEAILLRIKGKTQQLLVQLLFHPWILLELVYSYYMSFDFLRDSDKSKCSLFCLIVLYISSCLYYIPRYQYHYV